MTFFVNERDGFGLYIDILTGLRHCGLAMEYFFANSSASVFLDGFVPTDHSYKGHQTAVIHRNQKCYVTLTENITVGGYGVLMVARAATGASFILFFEIHSHESHSVGPEERKHSGFSQDFTNR